MGNATLFDIARLCKHSVTVEINNHRDYHRTTQQVIDESNDIREETEPEVIEQMIKTNTIVIIQAYPKSAGTFYKVYHFDLQAALNEMFKALNEGAFETREDLIDFKDQLYEQSRIESVKQFGSTNHKRSVAPMSDGDRRNIFESGFIKGAFWAEEQFSKPADADNLKDKGSIIL